MAMSRTLRLRRIALSTGAITGGFAIAYMAQARMILSEFDAVRPAIVAMGLALATFTIAWVGSIGMSKLASRSNGMTNRSPRLLADLVSASMYVMALLVTISTAFGQSGATFLAGSGLILAVIGFAIRNVVADTLSGVALGLEAPFKIGDWIETEEQISGRVVEVGWRTTRLSTRDATHIILPNSQIARQRLTNFSAPRLFYSTRVEVHVVADADPQWVRQTLKAAAMSASSICKDPPPDVQLVALDPEGMRMSVRYWVPSFLHDSECRNEVLCQLVGAMQAHDLLPLAKQCVIANPAGSVPQLVTAASLPTDAPSPRRAVKPPGR